MTQTGTFTPEDLAQLPEIVAADLAPDGGSTVYAASTRDGKTVVEHTLLWRQVVGGSAELLSDSDSSQGAPSISPDGGRVAFLQDVEGRPQVAVLDLVERTTRLLTDFPRGVGAEAPRWSPDGAVLAFAASDAPPRDLARPYRITRPVWRRDGMGLVDDVLADVWTVPAEGGAPTRLTFHDGVVSNVQWSPDGTRLLYACFAEPDSATFALRTIQADGSRVEVVTTGDYLVYPPAAAWLSDGRIVRTTAWDIYRTLDLLVHDPATGSDTPLGVVVDGQIGGLMVFGMNSTLFAATRLLVDRTTDDVYLYVQTGGRLDLHRIATSDGRDETVLTGDASVAPLALCGRQVLLARSTFADPASLVVLDLADGTEQPASTLDRMWLAPAPFTAHELHFTGEDGTPVEAWFLEPDVGSAPYPTVLNIHGGPFAVHGHAFSMDNHLLTSAGYGVLMVNYRGSSGYGEDFAASLLGDWGHHDAGDLLAGIDHAASLGLTDPARLGSFGLSGGGYLTSWLLTHSDRFSAGIAECPVTDWNGMVGSDIPQVVSRWMGSDPGHGPAAMSEYARVSPATYAAACSTPMLIIEHESDLRCPSGQGDVLYNALVVAGCTTEMLRLPGMFHVDVYGVADLAGRTERLAALTDWFDRHLKP
jgi:dipeptidyl aminopeptidase/acylaminoacyl peptidase